MAEHPPRRPRREDEDDSFAERKQKSYPAKKQRRSARANKRSGVETGGEIPVVLRQAAETPDVLPEVTKEAEEKKEEENVDSQGEPAAENDTRAEWEKRMIALIGRVQEKLNVASERLTTFKAYLNARAKEIDARAEMSGGEKIVRGMGELYDKLNWREKLGIGLVFGASAVVSGGASIYLPYAFAGLLGLQRAFGMASLFLNQEKELQKAKIMEFGQIISVKERAAVDAVLSGAVMGVAIGKSIEWANESGLVERTREWLGEMLGHGATATETPIPVADVTPQEVAPPPETSVAEAPSDIAVPPTQEYVPPATATAIEAPAVPSAPEVPSISVEATKGRGYEYMMKRVWEQLQDKGLDASQYAEGSDIRRLLEADAQSIDRVVHQIAADPEHGFFNQDGTSVRIDMGSQMTINADGDIRLGDVVKAPEGAPVTPAYHPEALVSDAEAPADMTYAPESVGEPYVETLPARPADAIATQSPAPIEDRSFVSNRFGLPISTAEPHIYAGADAKNTFVFGGTPIEMKKAMLDYLKENPNKIVFAASENGKYRLAWHLVGGQIEPAGPPVRAEGFFNSIFNFFRGSSWMKPPGLDDLRQIIK